MKLLKTEEGKSKRSIDNAAQELRGVQLDALIVSKRKELDSTDRQLTAVLSEKGQQGQKEESFWKERISELTREVDALESRRKAALVPLQEREKAIQDKESVLLKREEQSSIKESDLERTRELLEDKLDDVSEREQTAIDYAGTLESRSSVLSLQEDDMQKRQDALVSVLRQAVEEKAREEALLSQQKAMLKGREVVISEREAEAAKKEKSFADREKKILDQYQTLQRAIAEVKLKYGDKLKL